MQKVKSHLKKYPLNTIPILIFVVIIFFTFNMYSYKIEVNSLLKTKNEITENSKEAEWELVKGIIDNNFKLTKEKSRYFSKKLEVELLKNYRDLSELEKEFQSKEFSPKFFNILKECFDAIDNKGSEITYIGIKDGILSAFSNEEITLFNKENNDIVIPWSSIVNGSINPILNSEAIDKIISKNKSLIIFQDGDSDVSVNLLEDMSYNSLKDVYFKEGVKGFKSIFILAAAYITEGGDIFGTNDYTFTNTNNNHKIYLVQQINIEEILENNISKIDKYELDRNENLREIDYLLDMKIIVFLSMQGAFIVLLLFFSHLYNSIKDEAKNCV